MSRSSPTKKRKVGDGRIDTADGAHDDGGGFLSSWFGYFSGRGDNVSSATSRDVNNSSQLDRMEQMMIGMGEQLATVNSRCAALESKCSSLEDKLESISQTAKENDKKVDSLNINLDNKCSSLETKLEGKVDALQVKAQQYHEYNAMLVRNQSWEYSAVVASKNFWLSQDYDNDLAACLEGAAKQLRDMTIKMRRGEFSDKEFDDGVERRKGIILRDDSPIEEARYPIEELLPHWKEFAAALQQFTPTMVVVPDKYETYFHAMNLVLDRKTMELLREALIGKPFSSMRFYSNHYGHHGVAGMDAILDVVVSNKYLRRLGISGEPIDSVYIERLCAVVHDHPCLVELQLYDNFVGNLGTGNAFLASLLTRRELKLEVLHVSVNHITSEVSTLLADFLATNPRLKELNLEDNGLNDNDAELIANALRSNTTLQKLFLEDNDITESGNVAFRRVLCDESSLNALVDSNHSCNVLGLYFDLSQMNSSDFVGNNRGRKIYSLLSRRNVMTSNAQHFSDIDVKLLPNMLEAVQQCAKFAVEDQDSVRSLSIVYELVRWEKVFNMCQSSGVEH